MKLRNFAKLFTGLLAISALPASIVFSNSNPQIHSSFFVENKATNDISWTIGDNGIIKPTDKTQIRGTIEIPSVWDGIPVTGIANNAFSDCDKLISITFAEGIRLTSIAIGTFQNCSSLTSINISNSVTSIGDNAFNDCSSLTSVNFDNGSQLTSIGTHAFKNCNTLTSINIPSGVTSIGDNAFADCSSLTDVTFNWNEEQLKKLQLYNSLFINYTSSQTISFHIPWGTKDQYKARFTQDILGTNITAKWISYIQWSITDDGLISPADKGQIQGEITIPDTVNGKTVTGIANSAFDSCSALTSITIPSGVTSIGDYAFSCCSSLTDVTFNWDSGQLLVADKLTLGTDLFNNTSRQTINFHIPLGTKGQYKAKFTQDILGTNITANWIDGIVPSTPTPTNSSNLGLILGLTFGFIILIGIGSYLWYRYYKHRKNSKK